MDDQRQCPACGKPVAAGNLQGLCPACLLQAGLSASTLSAGPRPNPGHSRFVAPMPEELAPLFPQLEILSLIGQGGMGAVYRARQPSLDRVVALKILPPGIGPEAGFEERFTREARALARLHHPNIVAVHDFGSAGSYHYFLMEYVDGATLRHVLATATTTPREALAIVPQICDALQYAHDKGIVHRDIKPENILVDKTGVVKIADFGLAKLIGANSPDLAITGERDVMGTPHYMAPEQVEHPLSVDHRADIYSLGVVFYQMLTGELPLGRFAPPSRKVQIDVRLDEVVLRALEKEPDQRYQQASGFKTAVEIISSTDAKTEPASKDASKLGRSRTFTMTVAITLLVLVGGTMVAWLSRRPVTHADNNPSQMAAEPARSTSKNFASSISSLPAALPLNAADSASGKSRAGSDMRARQRASQVQAEPRVIEADTPRHEDQPVAAIDPIAAHVSAADRSRSNATRTPADFDAMESNPEILQIQLRQAEAEKADTVNRVSLGIASHAELQRAAARVELFRARLADDRVGFNRIKLKEAGQRLDETTARYRAGNAPGVEVHVATDDVKIAEARLRDAEKRATSGAVRD